MLIDAELISLLQGTVQFSTVPLAPGGRQVYLEIRYLFNIPSCSLIRIGRKSCSLSSGQPAAYLANGSQSEAVCGVACPASAEAFLRAVESERIARCNGEEMLLTGVVKHM